MSFSNVEGSEDVHDFLQRIKEIGRQRDQEDEERNRKLEEAIIQGRKERQARRAERARSISPTKKSPAETLLRSRCSVPQNLSFSEFPQLCAKSGGSELQHNIADSGSIPSREIPLPIDAESALAFSSMSETEGPPLSLSNATISSPILSPHRRYSSQACDPRANRQNSLIAMENATKYQSNTLDSSHTHEGNQSCSREQKEQTPGFSDLSRDQHLECSGLDSPASDVPICDDHRNSDLESARITKISSTSNCEFHHDLDNTDTKDHSASPTKDFSDSEVPKNFLTSFAAQGVVNDPPITLIASQKPDSKPGNRNPAVSATSRCISPERPNQSSSPTKGMGGFVQSAMMRRNDSVNKKRWSANNSPNINKTKSVPNIVLASTNSKSSNLTSENELCLGNRSHSSLDQPIATHDRPITPASARSDLTMSSRQSPIENEIGPDVRVGNVQRFRSASPCSNILNQQETPTSFSPSKTMDRRRWSPTKSSWLEAVLNKPDLFKQRPKAIPAPQQPAWMSEISKAKQRPHTETNRSSSLAPKHEVNIGGLMRSRPTGGQVPVGNFPATLNSGFTPGKSKISSGGNVISARPESTTSVTNSTSSPFNVTPTLQSRPKTDELLKKDFRANLKPRKPQLGSENANEPELKNVFFQLRPTKTQSYVAPDDLKNNITRGKAALNITGGPRKSEQKDEFKEAILKKKEDFRKVQLEGKGISRTSSGNQTTTLPEALVKQRALGTSDSVSSDSPISLGLKSYHQSISHSRTASVPSTSQLQTNEFVKITDKISPDLTRLLSQGTNLNSGHKRQSYSVNPVFEKAVSNSEFQNHVQKLTHLTKERDRGPRRKPPSINQTSYLSQGSVSVEKNSNLAVNPCEFSFPTALVSDMTTPAKPEPKVNYAVTHPSTSQSEIAQETESTDDKLDAPPVSSKEIHPLERVTYDRLPEASKTESHDLNQVIEEISPGISPVDQGRSKSVSSTFSTKTVPEQSKISESSNPIDTKQLDQGQPPQAVIQNPETVEISYQKSVVDEETYAQQDILSSATHVKINSENQPIDEKTSSAFLNLNTDHSVTKQDELISNSTHNTSQTMTSPAANSSELVTLSTASPQTPTLQNPDCFTALTRFFDRTKSPEAFDFDTLNLLSSRPEENLKTSSLHADLFLFSSCGKKQLVPSNQERIFFEENTYICVHTYKSMSGKILTEVFLWVGDEISTNVLQITEDCAKIESKVVGGDLFTIRQGKETPQFFVALGGFIIVQCGSSNKYNSLAPRILCARNYHGHIAFDEVDFSSNSLCSGFSYLISTQYGKCYLWKGRGTSVEELTCAKLVGMDFGLTGEIEEVEEGKEPLEFLQIFGKNTQMPESADYWELKPQFSRYRARLFVADESSKEKISEIKPFNQQDLNERQKIYILDVFFEIYILIGSESKSQYSAFHNALIFVQEYSILAAGMEERPFVPAVNVILDGIPRNLTAAFRKWKNSEVLGYQCQTESSLLMLPLTEVLEAIRD